MASRTTANIDSMELDFNDLIYRTNVFIMENDSQLNYEATYSLIDYMERILTPYIDDIYNNAIKELDNRDIPKSKNAAQAKSKYDKFKHSYMMGKHTALMKLSFRRGFLPTPKNVKDIHND